MKRVCILLLAVLLLLTGCAGKLQAQDISVKDVCCPYEIKHENDEVLITLQDGNKSGILWDLEVIPDDVCEVTQENTEKEHTCSYRVAGKIEGAAQLTFTALQDNETVPFVLTTMVNVDATGKVLVMDYQHRERTDTVVDEGGLNYKWNIDVNGALNFSFINDEDSWSVRSEEEGSCMLTEALSTPSGCKFSAQANTVGQTTVVLVGETTQRKINVIIQVDDNANMQVISVQEQ